MYEAASRLILYAHMSMSIIIFLFSVQEGAIMFIGDLNDTEVGVVSHMVRHVTAGHLNVSVDELTIEYQLAQCFTSNK